MQNKILLIGPRSNIKNPELTGGVIVLFEDLVSYCDRNNIHYIIIDTNKNNYKNKIYAYVLILLQCIVKLPRVKIVSLHGTANDYVLIAPFIVFLTKLYKKKMVLRKFAGNFDEVYHNASGLKKSIIKYVLKNSSINFFETKYLVEYFQRFNKYTYWFANVRKQQVEVIDDRYNKRFVFIGSVSKEKGMEVLCEAALQLPHSYTVDVYGQLQDGFTKEYLQKHNLNYKGKLKNSDVIPTLLEYDVLVLPSYREGYPGIIIEALSIGMPVIATNLQGIVEMIDKNSSVLIPVGDTSKLKEAFEAFHNKNYKDMSACALEQFKNFDSDIQTANYFELVMQGEQDT